MFQPTKSALWLTTLTLLALATPARAQQAFTGKGQGSEVDEIVVDGGVLIQYGGTTKGSLGSFVVVGQHVETRDGTLTDGMLTFETGNGDQIFCVYRGTTDPDGDFGITVNIIGGTGQYQGATGTMSLKGQDWGNGAFGIIYGGAISY